jgi:hypothetical protein
MHGRAWIRIHGKAGKASQTSCFDVVATEVMNSP